jgi:hypothetical protein
MVRNGSNPDSHSSGFTTSGRRGRNESAEERADRMWDDLLQELRVAQTGAQIILGVLIVAVFHPVFGDLAATDRAL